MTLVTTGATAVTVIADVPDLPEQVAVIVADPAAAPETTPLEFTVAAAGLLVDHVTVWPVITLPFWSLTVAWRVVVVPIVRDAEGGVTSTLVTTGGWGPDCVEAEAIFEGLPNTALPLMLPRKAFTWNS